MGGSLLFKNVYADFNTSNMDFDNVLWQSNVASTILDAGRVFFWPDVISLVATT
jgi:hypothetical protein